MSGVSGKLSSARHVLLCLRWGIGDVIMELPLLQALRTQVRGRITVLGAAPAVELLDGVAWVDDIVEVQRFGFTHWGDAGNEEQRADVARWCRKGGFDCILDGSHAPRGARQALWSVGLPWLDTGGWLDDGSGTGDAIGRADAANGAAEGACEGLALLVSAAEAVWGVRVSSARPRLELRPREEAEARQLIRSMSKRRSVVGLAPMASSPLKRASTQEFARAADRLVNAHDARVLLFGGKEGREADAVSRAMEHSARAFVIQPMHLRKTAALLAECSVVISNDTGLMHVAAAAGAKVVAVFACTSPGLYLPPGATALQRWEESCRYLEAREGRFGVTPCVAAGRCLDAGHRHHECWADAAAAAASPQLAGATGPTQRR